MKGRVNQLEMVPEMVGIIEVLADAIEQLDPPNQHLAKVARFASRIATKAKIKSMGASPQTPEGMGVGVADRAAPDGQERKAQNPQVGGFAFCFAFAFGGPGFPPAHTNPRGFV